MTPSDIILSVFILACLGILFTSIWIWFDSIDVYNYRSPSTLHLITRWCVRNMWKMYILVEKEIMHSSYLVGVKYICSIMYWTGFIIFSIVKYALQGIYYLIRYCLIKWFELFIPKRVKEGWKELRHTVHYESELLILAVLMSASYTLFFVGTVIYPVAYTNILETGVFPPLMMFLAIIFGGIGTVIFSVMGYRLLCEVLHDIFKTTYINNKYIGMKK